MPSIKPNKRPLFVINTMSFSKDIASGTYLSCNQSFAEFANKSTPEEVVGLTDHDIFDADTADLFIDNDKIALSMDEPYTFFEDVRDATGASRHLQAAKQKIVDQTGRLRLHGIAVDVSDLTRAKQEHEETQVAYAEALNTSAIYKSIVNALASNYFDLYYVNAETGEYVEFGSRTNEGNDSFARYGDDFFAESKQNAQSIIYEEDQDKIARVLSRDELLELIDEHGTYVYQYRLLVDGKPTYVSMKAARIPGDDEHIIVGVSDVDSQVKNQKAAERAKEERETYQRLNALNGNLLVLYFVDLETEEYTEYSSSKSYEGLGIAKHGSDFFQSSHENGMRLIHPDDLALFREQVTKENVLATIGQNGVFALDYRLMMNGLPTYVRLKAATIEENGKPLLIVGLQDEDAQIRQEQEYARKLSDARTMATVDSLTGIKNKHAYAQWEKRIDKAIREGKQEPFAIAICDINNLKDVNDLYGHKEGDACIKAACANICMVFNHSPVFRIGGDEFAVIMSGGDYDRRHSLVEKINLVPHDISQVKIGETISAGMAEYRSDRHSSLLDVFEEADKDMYERKQNFKQTCLVDVNQVETEPPQSELPVFNERKRILIADDIETNLEILGDLLEEDYDVLYATDGVEALETLRKHKDEISLVLLDLYMPNMTGREVIAAMQVDEDLVSIPVVFLTVDQDAELDCLKIGAMDFIPKPYPDIEIVKARISKCIELSEGRELIRYTERDKLTGLLNRDYFFRYAIRLDHIHKESSLDAVVCDIDRFHAINKKHGRRFGDQILRSVGAAIRKLARKTGGSGCRQEGDTFLLYCVHQNDYEQLLEAFMMDVNIHESMANEVNLRFGVCTNAQQEPDVEERFVYAMIAADRVKDHPNKVVGFYELD